VVITRLSHALAWLFAVAILLCTAGAASAQTMPQGQPLAGQTTTTGQNALLTPDQLLMLQKLTPEQREALSRMLLQSQGGASTGQTALPATTTPELDQQLDSLRRIGIPPGETTATVGTEATGIPRLEAESSVIVEMTLRADLGDRLVTDPKTHVVSFDGEPIPERVARLIGRNVFQLDRYGVLTMEGAYRIPLAGLTPEEAARRIAAETDLRIFDVTLTLLPLEPMGTKALELFGHTLFNEVPTTFAPATDIPVPPDYVIGPGDTISVQLFGNRNEQLALTVTREGMVQFPEIGPMQVAGLTFEEMRAELDRHVNEQMIGVRTSITMGPLRSVRIFVMGDASRPGSYAVSGLSTMTNALFASGGILESGSLRNVTLKRNGEQIGRLDLYDLLLRGDASHDLRLQSGDVIFVPPIGRTIGVEGEVVRPAIYELKDEHTVGDVIALAGGLRPSARKHSGSLERYVDNERTVIGVDLGSPTALATPVANGDVLHVRPVYDQGRDTVTLTGNVQDARDYQWRAGMRLTDLIPSVDALLPGADLHYVLIRRELPPDRRLEAHSADLAAALAARGSEADIPLSARDTVIVFDLKSDRGPIVRPFIDELIAQARDGRPVPEVDIAGRVNTPGQYPYEPGMRVSDLLRAGGLLNEAAYPLEAELTRYASGVEGERRAEIVNVDLQRVLAADPDADLLLQPHDFLTIKEVPQWSEQESVEVAGEVRFPGVYPIQRNETLSSVLHRAGGLSDAAFPEGAIFLRVDLKAREKEQLQQLATRLQSDLLNYSLQAAQQKVDAGNVLSMGQTLLDQLSSVQPTGRLVIDITRIMQARQPGDYDVLLRNGDKLLVPKRTQEITVIGEVQNGTTSHVFEPTFGRDDYIARSGGFTKQADKHHVYVVRANGEVSTGERSVWFKRSGGYRMQTGDTIVVPIDAGKMPPLARWAAVSQIIYQLALATASAHSVGVL
jgi:protein involved in polysaccharide export with SLBB domain